jgi:hypothetical protein
MDRPMRPRPFKSKLIPYVDQIKRWRRTGKTWQEVADELEKLGCKSDPGNICRFISRWKRKPYPIGAEPDSSFPELKSPAPKQPVIEPINLTDEDITKDSQDPFTKWKQKHSNQ